jgi:hypothetical protein
VCVGVATGIKSSMVARAKAALNTYTKPRLIPMRCTRNRTTFCLVCQCGMSNALIQARVSPKSNALAGTKGLRKPVSYRSGGDNVPPDL